MKRREFLKSTLLFAAVSTVAGKAAGIFNNALAGVTFVTAKKLGYQEVSPQAKAGKQCSTCRHYKASAAGGAGSGQCTLAAMSSLMKSKEVYVKDGAYCNMWAKKA